MTDEVGDGSTVAAWQAEHVEDAGDTSRSAARDDARLAATDDLGRQLVHLVRLIERSKAQLAASRGHGLERAGFVLLARLVEAGPQRLSALAEAVHSDPSTASRQVAHLVQSRLVERHQDQLDGRASLLAATDSGRRLFDEHRKARTRHIAAVLADWPGEDLCQLAGLLKRLNRNLEDYRERLLNAGVERGGTREQKGMTP